MTPTPIPNVYIVPVPGNALDIKISDFKLLCYRENEGGEWWPHEYLQGNYTLLGYCTADYVSFDPEPYLESGSKGWYLDYNNTDPTIHKRWFNYPKDSFISAVKASGKYFVNPYGDGKADLSGVLPHHFASAIDKWQEAKKNTSPKYAVLFKNE